MFFTVLVHSVISRDGLFGSGRNSSRARLKFVKMFWADFWPAYKIFIATTHTFVVIYHWSNRRESIFINKCLIVHYLVVTSLLTQHYPAVANIWTHSVNLACGFGPFKNICRVWSCDLGLEPGSGFKMDTSLLLDQFMHLLVLVFWHYTRVTIFSSPERTHI